jgi:hypothetical protein
VSSSAPLEKASHRFHNALLVSDADCGTGPRVGQGGLAERLGQLTQGLLPGRILIREYHAHPIQSHLEPFALIEKIALHGGESTLLAFGKIKRGRRPAVRQNGTLEHRLCLVGLDLPCPGQHICKSKQEHGREKDQAGDGGKPDQCASLDELHEKDHDQARLDDGNDNSRRDGDRAHRNVSQEHAQ